MPGFFSKKVLPWVHFETENSVFAYVNSNKGMFTISDSRVIQELFAKINSAEPIMLDYPKPADPEKFEFFISSHTYTLSITPTANHGLLYANVLKRSKGTNDGYYNQLLIKSPALWDFLTLYRDIDSLQAKERLSKFRMNERIENAEESRTVYLADFDEADIAVSLFTHCIDEQTFHWFNQFDRGLMAEFQGRNLLRVRSLEESEDEDPTAGRYPNRTLEDISFAANRIFFLKKSSGGNHRIGGDLPPGFIKPSHPDLKTPFQYIGTIDGQDPKFDWLGVDKLHIVFPVNECLTTLFLDYTDPDSPSVVKLVDRTDSWFNTSGRVGDVLYRQVNYEVCENIESATGEDALDRMNVGGVPFWYNDPKLSRCPKTGGFMRFVCSIRADRENEVLNPEEAFPETEYPDVSLSFVYTLHLYIFYCPESKILYATR